MGVWAYGVGVQLLFYKFCGVARQIVVIEDERINARWQVCEVVLLAAFGAVDDAAEEVGYLQM